MDTTMLASAFARYALDTAADAGADLATARRMMADEPAEVCEALECDRDHLDAWLAEPRTDVTAPEWTEAYGSVGNARKAGVCGRLAEVSDGTMTYVQSSTESDAAEMLERFASTASYTGVVRLRGRIVDADGETLASGVLSRDFGGV